MNRRKFIKGATAASTLGLIAGLYSWQIEPFWLEFVKLKMPIKNLPEKLINTTLMQISDIHLGNRFDRKFIINSFEKAKKYTPDFVVYTGDFISYESDEQLNQLEEVLNSIVLGKKGTIAILGNHDYGKNWAQNDVAEKIVSLLNSHGVIVLRNEQQSIEGLNFIGLVITGERTIIHQKC